MWQRFTEKTRRVIFRAQEEAARLGENYVGTEHLLLGLVRESDCVAARILERLGAGLRRVREDIERQVARGDGRLGQEMQLTPRAKGVIDVAYEEARQLNNKYIGTEHLLLGILRQTDGIAGRVLARLGVDADRTRREILALQEDTERPAPKPTEPPRPGAETSRGAAATRDAIRMALASSMNAHLTDSVPLALSGRKDLETVFVECFEDALSDVRSARPELFDAIRNVRLAFEGADAIMNEPQEGQQTGMNTRTEKDSLGNKEVPADAYYGIQTQRAIENFPITGLKPWPVFVDATVMVKKAAAEANRDLGRLPIGKANLIVQVADEILEGSLRDQFMVDPIQAGAGTSHNMNTNEVIANRAAEILEEPRGSYETVNPNDHVNMAQSTNDVIPTAMRVACALSLPGLYKSLDAMIEALQAKADEFDGVVKSGRTHLQDAAPVRLGQEFGAYAEAIRKAKKGIEEAAERVKVLGIGGTAVGSGLNAGPDYPQKVVDYLNQYTGAGFSSNPNLFHAMQDQAPILDLSAAIRTLAVSSTRIANDFRLLSSGPVTGLDEIRLPAVQPGSSIMPGKVNPVMAEMLNMACNQVIGNDTAVMMAVQAGQLELNVMMPQMAWSILFSMKIMTNALDAFTRFCVVGITAQEEKCRAYVEKNPIIATALNPIIGYGKVAELVKQSLKEDRPIIDVAADAGVMPREELERILDPKKLTDPTAEGPAGAG